MLEDLSSQCQRLYDAKAAQMTLYGRALGLSHVEAEDVLQETFLAMIRLPAIPERLEHYCLRVFRNRALNYRRGLLRRLIRELESRNWFEPAACDDREASVMRQLAELPAEQREAIVLKIWQKCTFEEIGSLAGISPNTAAARYRYGLQKLRNSLNEDAYENDGRLGERTSDLDPAESIRPTQGRHLWPASS
jgi:RNA polymerase sigma-70 factor, ECF subfamily